MKKNTENQNLLEAEPRVSPRASLFFIIFSAILVIVDQISKYLVLQDAHLMSGGRYVLIENFFNLRYTLNTGAAWSILADVEWGIFLLIVISVVASIAFFIFLVKYSGWPKFLPFCISLAWAGTVGNLIDRVRHRGVVDFFDFQFGTWHFPTFNVADACIVVGMLGILIYILFFETRHREKFRTDQRFTVRKL